MPLDFLKSLLERDGALVEARGDGALEAVVPDQARVALGLADDAPVLAVDGRAGSVACGYGTELLRAACARAIGEGRVSVARANVTVGRTGPLDVFAGLNVALRPGAASAGEVWTVTARLRVDASADDRRVLATDVSLALDATPVPIPRLDWSGAALEPTDAAPPLASVEAALARSCRAAAFEATAPFREAVARRARRDVERIDRYFAELDLDLATRIAKAKSADGLESKRALLPAERERRLRTLRENAVVRVRVEPAALLFVLAPAVRAPLEVLRRKARRTVEVAWHPLLRAWLPLGCEGCGAGVRAFGACDEAVHVLCASCLRTKECPRCSRRAPEALVRQEEQAALEETITIDAFPDGSPLGGATSAEPAASEPVSAKPPLAVTPPAPREAPPKRLRAASGSTVIMPAVAPEAAPRPATRRPKKRPIRNHAAVRAERHALRAELARILAATTAALSSEEIQARCRVFSTEELRRALTWLVKEGRVERTGQARGSRYRWRRESP